MHEVQSRRPIHLMNINQVAALLSVSPKTVYYWVNRNEIPFTRVGRHLRFNADEVIGFFRQKTDDSRLSCRPAPPLLEDLARSLKIGRRGPALQRKE